MPLSECLVLHIGQVKVTGSFLLPVVETKQYSTFTSRCTEICDAFGWPALPSRQSTSSTHVLSRTQPWKELTTNLPNGKVHNLRTALHRCFRWLGSPLMLTQQGARTESNSASKRLQGRLTTGPQTLAAGDFAVKRRESKSPTIHNAAHQKSRKRATSAPAWRV